MGQSYLQSPHGRIVDVLLSWNPLKLPTSQELLSGTRIHNRNQCKKYSVLREGQNFYAMALFTFMSVAIVIAAVNYFSFSVVYNPINYPPVAGTEHYVTNYRSTIMIAVLHIPLLAIFIYTAAPASGSHINPSITLSTVLTGYTRVFGTAFDPRQQEVFGPIFPPIMVGFVLAICIIVSSGLLNHYGMGFNIARCFGPAVVMGRLSESVYNYRYIVGSAISIAAAGVVIKNATATKDKSVHKPPADQEKGVVYVYDFVKSMRQPPVPHFSPYVMKVVLFLKYANIPYKIIHMGPRQKFPYVALDGEFIYDSNFIIEELSKRYNVTERLQISNDAVVNAQGHLIRRCIDEAFTWAMVYSRWGDTETNGPFLQMIFGGLPTPIRQLVQRRVVKQIGQGLWTNGVSRQTNQEIYSLASETLAALSVVLGDKDYILSDTFSLCDISMFSSLANILYVPQVDSPILKALVKHDNLVRYLDRIRSTYFDDRIKAYSA
eukprot:gene11944-13919_t